jgi:NADH-quinone oxidoreductase subunit M
MNHLLTIFLFPLIGMFAVRLLAGRKQALTVALIIALITLGDTLFKLSLWNYESGMQLIFNRPWVESLGINFNFGVDGLGMLMILLTNVLMPLIIFSAFDREIPDHKNYLSLIFLMQFALLGVFTSMDGFLFYVFWELALIPIWFICLLWGGADRNRITLKFFIYTLAGSLLMLAGMIYLYLQTPGSHNFDLQSFITLQLTNERQSWLFWAFFAAFAIKIPIFPFHTWQPDTYTSAPTQGTMLLSGIMLKMGLYGMIRWMIPVIPQGVDDWAWLAIGLSVIGMLYASGMAIAQKDFKRLIAYASIAHVGLIAAGIVTFSPVAIQGGIYQMLSHGVNAIGLFFIADILQSRFGNRPMEEMGGIAHTSRVFAVSFMVILLGSIALPLTNGFVGEFLLLSGLYQSYPWMTAFAGLTVVLGAVYMLRAYQKIMLGDVTGSSAEFRPVSPNEKILLIIIVILVVVMGVYPAPLLQLAEPAVNSIISASGIVQ